MRQNNLAKLRELPIETRAPVNITKMPASRSHHLDMMRALAIACVLIIHSATRYAVTDAEMLLGNWLSTFTRPCIAIFLFLSGYIMSNRAFTSDELGRRLKRVLLPYGFFSIFALIYSYRPRLISGDAHVVQDMLFSLLIGQSFDIYYFVLVISWTYIIYFLIKKYQANVYLVLTFFVGLTLLHNAYLPQICERMTAMDLGPCPGAYQYRYVFWPVFFFAGVCGREAGIMEKAKAHRRAVMASWGMVFVIYNCLFFMGFSRIEGYDSIIGTLYSTVTVLALLTFKVSSPSRIATYLSEKSYFLYLSHIFVVYFLFDAFRHFAGGMHYWYAGISLLLSLTLPIAFYELQRKAFGNRFAPLLGTS